MVMPPESARSLTKAEPSAPVRPGLDAIYREHFGLVWRSLRRLGVPEADVIDAAQEVFVVAHRRLPSFEGRSSVRTWLFAIARRVAQHARRSAGRRRRKLHALEQAGTISAPGQDDIAEARRLYALLDLLTAKQREAFVLTRLEGMTAEEAAVVLGLKPSSVHSRVQAARRKLEHAIFRQGERS
jgi:RNA polymerase sigma-70 factor (ECF subfamily)